MSTTGAVAQRLVDLVRRRVGLVGEQAGPRALGRGPPRDLGDRGAGVATAALLARRVDRADPGDAVRRRVGAGQVHPLAVLVLPEPDPAPRRSARRIVVRVVLAARGCRRPAGLLGGVSTNAWNHASTSSASSSRRRAAAGRAPTRARPGRRARRAGCARATAAVPPVSRAISSAHDPGGRQRAVDAARLLAARVQTARASARAASSGIGSTNSGCGGNGAVRIATPATSPGVVADDRPPARVRRAARPPAATSASIRSVTVATTVVSTGSWARCAPAASRKAPGSSMISTVNESGSAARSWTQARQPVDPGHRFPASPEVRQVSRRGRGPRWLGSRSVAS